MSDIVATERVTYKFQGVSVTHEIYNEHDKFRHRLVALDFVEGGWVNWEWHAVLEFDANGITRKFMAVQSNWTPMFPECFEVTAGEKL